jgi:hypothetical protein
MYVAALATALACLTAAPSCGDDLDPDPCLDGLQSGAESDVDCGGSCVQLCALAATCGAASDCVSGCCNAAGACDEDSDEDGVCDADVCEPACDERLCGADGCGGSCGACGEYESCTEAGVCEIPSLEGWPDAVTIFPFLDDQLFEGDIAAGTAADVGWADEALVSCWTFVMGKYFSGNQVFYAMDKQLQKSSQLEITVTPAEGVDLNVYAFALQDGVFYMPPAVPVVSDCTYSKSGDAGVSESVYLQNLQAPLQWLIAVVGPEGLSEGAFTLRIDRTDVLP